ncbi:PIN domain-containing protein [Halothermothrix orenii]|uniref:PIN domain protein n=1 Tax=Halothermothrix orenii (strain H 168 / OCM 544 / DSM 9562) TaxID=373903 RepID=B8CXV3_HALOH|nr:PIN domain-containing protein [Halothermothrix orenii]ACL70122.1 PIN domain protein [Halothermothrix orenii H 168]
MKKITIDLNVILDFLNKRKKHVQAAKIIELCNDNQIQGYICAHEITTLAYFLMKNYNNSNKVKFVLNELLDMFKIIPITETILRKALNSKIKDFEDAVIEISSHENEIDYIVTRNLDDFKHSSVKSISPTEFLALYNKFN